MIEYETKVLDINRDVLISKLRELWAEEFDEVLLKRRVFKLPQEDGGDGRFIRLRDEWDKITLTYKERKWEWLGNTQEVEIIVDDFEKTYEILSKVHWYARFYQENKRHKFVLWDIEFCIDTRPMIPTYIEIESNSSQKVEEWLKMLWLEWKDEWNISVLLTYQKYWIDLHKFEKIMF